jgi:hypothetical protein
LLDAGANPLTKSEEEKTAFDHIKENSALEGTEAYKKLLEMQRQQNN